MGLTYMSYHRLPPVVLGTVIDDDKLYIVSPAVNKPVCGVMSTALTNSNQFYENADLSQNFTMRKGYSFEFIGASFAGLYSING